MTPKDVIFNEVQFLIQQKKPLFNLLVKGDASDEAFSEYAAIEAKLLIQFAEYDAILAKEHAAEKSRLIGEHATYRF